MLNKYRAFPQNIDIKLGGNALLIIAIRTIILYLLIIFALRLMGKKQLGELQPSELVTTILVSNIATLALEDTSLPMLMGIIPIIMIVCLDVIVSGIMMKSGTVRRIITGTPRIIITDGQIDQNEMRNLRYTLDDLIEAMREKEIFNLDEVQYAIVETNGSINFFEKSDSTDDGNEPSNPPAFIIKDGEVNKRGLKELNLDELWLNKTLKAKKLSAKDIFLMTADSEENCTIIKKTGKG